jgi:hypothetical protein
VTIIPRIEATCVPSSSGIRNSKRLCLRAWKQSNHRLLIPTDVSDAVMGGSRPERQPRRIRDVYRPLRSRLCIVQNDANMLIRSCRGDSSLRALSADFVHSALSAARPFPVLMFLNHIETDGVLSWRLLQDLWEPGGSKERSLGAKTPEEYRNRLPGIVHFVRIQTKLAAPWLTSFGRECLRAPGLWSV